MGETTDGNLPRLLAAAEDAAEPFGTRNLLPEALHAKAAAAVKVHRFAIRLRLELDKPPVPGGGLDHGAAQPMAALLAIDHDVPDDGPRRAKKRSKLERLQSTRNIEVEREVFRHREPDQHDRILSSEHGFARKGARF
jgi:hypothetical protein